MDMETEWTTKTRMRNTRKNQAMTTFSLVGRRSWCRRSESPSVTTNQTTNREYRRAYVESSQSLEFISLLLSRYTPSQANQSLGSLKQIIPTGSLHASPVQPSQRSAHQDKNDELSALGRRIKSLGASADSLLGSAKRLRSEVEHETKYWQEMLDLQRGGLNPCKKPNEPHTLAIRYGFNEAVGFGNRGIAALRRGEDGGIKIGFDDLGDERKLLQVKILEQGEVKAVSRDKTSAISQETDLLGSIMHARKSLFDTELYSELHREARRLVSWGVRARDDSIEVPISPTTTIELSLAPRGLRIEGSQGKKSELQADAITTALRILLDHAHRESLRARAEPPEPVVEKTAPRSTYGLIRPVLEYFSHDTATCSLKTFIAGLYKTLRAAKLHLDAPTTQLTTLPALSNANHDTSTSSPDLLLYRATSISTTTSSAFSLVSRCMEPRQSKISMDLPSSSPRPPLLSIEIFTQIAPPEHYGTSFRSVLSQVPSSSLLTEMPQEHSFVSIEALKQHIFHLLRVTTTEYIVTQSPEQWGFGQPHVGRVDSVENGHGKVDGFDITFDEVGKEVSMTLILQSKSDTSDEKQTQTWGGGQNESGESQKGLMEVLGELTNGNLLG